MSIRRCVYKGCENFSVSSAPNQSFTLFHFPKDANRRQKWMELGMVNPHLPPNSLYMCSDHFDHSKHMSINQRRNVLLSTAVPYAYVGKNIAVESTDILTEASKVGTVESGDNENAPFMFFDEVEVAATVQEENDIAEEEQYPVESTIVDDENLLSYREMVIEAEENPSDDQEAENSLGIALSLPYRVEVEKNLITPNKKQRFTDTASESKICSKKLTVSWKGVPNKQKSNNHASVKSSSNLQQSRSKLNTVTQRACEPDGNNTVHTEFDESALIDTQYITTFIFKGEEYVQMPKDHYLSEKFVLMQKLEIYENALRSIKQKLSVLDNS